MSAETIRQPPIVGQEEPLNFRGFAEMPEYVAVNRALVSKLFLRLPSEGFTHVDVAAGTGMVPKLIIEASGATHKTGRIIGIDPNGVSLGIARLTTPRQSGIAVKYLQGYGQQLPQLLKGKVPKEGVDGVSMHDAIHEVEAGEDKEVIMRNMAAALKPGGVLSYNSAFTNRAMGTAGAEWGRWKLKAFFILNGKRDKEVKPIEVLKPEDYREMIERSGLIVIHDELRVITLSKTALEAISRYPKFIEGVFGDMMGTAEVDIGDKSHALIQALADLNVSGIQRTWHEIIAQKPL